MEKALTVIVTVLLFAALCFTVAFGAEDDITREYRVGDDSKKYLEVSLLVGQSAIGDGTIVDLKGIYSNYWCQGVMNSGTATVVLNVQSDKSSGSSATRAFANVFSPDLTLDSGNSDSFQFNWTNVGARWLRGYIVSGTDGDNTVTLDCVVGR